MKQDLLAALVFAIYYLFCKIFVATNPSTMKPTGSHVLIQQLPAETVTPGGILIPETAKRRGLKGKVVEVGPGEWNAATSTRLPMDTRKGQTVLFDKYAGQEMTVDGEAYLLMPEKAILLHFD